MAAPILLDHLTLADAPPVALIDAAAGAGFDGVGLFLRSLPEVPAMPRFDLVADAHARRTVWRAARDAGCAIGIAYPLSIGRSTVPGDHDALLDAAAEVEARGVNLLVYDRDVARRTGAVGALCRAAAARGLFVGLEFFPASAVGSLDDALALADAVGAANLGLTVDILHLMRSGGSAAALARHRDRILVAQLCDAPRIAPDDLFAEAASGRRLPDAGELDLPGFVAACGPGVTFSVEAPGGDRTQTFAYRARAARRAMDRVLIAPAPSPARNPT